MAVPMGSSAEVVIFGGFRRVVASFRVGQAWHFVTFRRVLQRVENRFAWQAQYFCDVFRRCVCSFRGRRITLDVSIVIFRGIVSSL